MAVPKYRTSKSKKKMRRSHHHLSLVRSVECSTAGGYKLPHALSSTQQAAQTIIAELKQTLSRYEL